MAQEDFCFMYYDGDAARDKAHMNRTERGGYDDIISLQRKIGHFKTEHAKKILSKDFDDCWPAIEMILKKDEEGKFYIEWLHKSIEKTRAHSKKQKERVDKRWVKNDENNTNSMPPTYPGNTAVLPKIENEDGDGNVNDNEVKGGMGEKGETPVVGIGYNPAISCLDVDFIKEKVSRDSEYLLHFKMWGLERPAAVGWMNAFNRFLQYGNVLKKTEQDYRRHFGNWLKDQDWKNLSPEDYSPAPIPKDFKNKNNGKITGRVGEILSGNVPKGSFGKL